MDASRLLLRRGLHVPAIRPPTVKKGSARLRVVLSDAHSEDDVALLWPYGRNPLGPYRHKQVKEGSARLRVALSAAHSKEDVALLAAALFDTGALRNVK
ncbi:hypothetical protein T484DRAFT_1764615 [Baffinella frigidus]|nr:hypothetical protein T484DRAFT_1764615 [Cryptophyta sp. CCMP2293]